MEKRIIKKVNGVVEEMSFDLDEMDNSAYKNEHLCWNHCENAIAGKCDKITDRRKKKIDRYDFITDGKQVVGPNNELIEFTVSGCKNYKEEPVKKMSVAEASRLRKLKESLLIGFYDAIDLAEARKVRDEIRRKNNQLPMQEEVKINYLKRNCRKLSRAKN